MGTDAARYTRLSVASEDDVDEGQTFDSVGHRASESSGRVGSFLFACFIAALAVVAAGAFHLSLLTSSSGIRPIPSTREVVSSLALGNISKNLEEGRQILHRKAKQLHPISGKMWFPASMTRVDATDLDRFFDAGSRIVLSPTDSMIYHWHFNSSWPRCYISGWVSPLQELIEGGKSSYAAEGDVTEIDVWNVDYTLPANPSSLSWNTRPKRLSLLGTVNFTDYGVQSLLHSSDGKELKKPTPLFDCSNSSRMTVEISCTNCRLEFDQIFSDPPLGFELIELA